MKRYSFGSVLAAGLVFLLLSAVLGMLYGSDGATLGDAIANRGNARLIVFDIRLKKVLLATVAGGGLAVVGGAFQALLRNPLAEPYILGVSGGAALGATAAIGFGLSTATALGAALTPLAALLGGLATTVLVYRLARRMPRGGSGASILLAGIMVNAICAAMITLAKMIVSPSRAKHMLRWLVGFIELPSTAALIAVAMYVVVGCGALLLDAGRMNLLALGEESAASLGLQVKRLERRVFLGSSCIVGAIVAMTGLIGFVGLVVPHAVRRLLGPDHRKLLPVAFVFGGGTLVLCDLLARLALREVGNKLPVGAVTALVGGPAFIYLLIRGARGSSQSA